MSVAPLYLGATLLFWGWQSGNLLVGALLAVLIEGVRWTRPRFDLRTVDYSRIADLSTVFFVGITVVFAADRGASHGMLAAFQWLPAVFAPVLLSQLLGETGRVPLSALLRYLRRLRKKNPDVEDPMVDVTAPYVVVAILAAGVANLRGPGFYAGAVLLAAWGLFTARPRHAPLSAWVLMLALGAGAGYAGHVGLAQLQTLIETWISGRQDFDSDPYRSFTEIGALGRLKLSDTIVLRVYADPKDPQRVRLLHRASYNDYAGTTWLARAAPMEPMRPEEDGVTWVLAQGRHDASTRIATRLEHGRALLALPPGTTQVSQLAAVSVRRNLLGAVYAETEGDWIQYIAQSADSIAAYAPPSADDIRLPGAERAVFQRIAAELELTAVPPAEASRRVERFLAGFSYSTWREARTPPGTTPLSDFITRTRSGHCEYFAAAATLLLRAGGVPARYATGFAVMEYSPLEGAFVVRARHAHAWTRVYADGRWLDLDTTPPSWFAQEERLAPYWQSVADLARWAGFRWSQRGELKAGNGWFVVLAVLAALLAWRLLRGRRLLRNAGTVAHAERRFAGADSEFYAVERTLTQHAMPREPGEPLSLWFRRIAIGLDVHTRKRLDDALRLHHRLRFDPIGLTPEERKTLRALCSTLAADA